MLKRKAKVRPAVDLESTAVDFTQPWDVDKAIEGIVRATKSTAVRTRLESTSARAATYPRRQLHVTCDN